MNFASYVNRPLPDGRSSVWDAHCKPSRDRQGADFQRSGVPAIVLRKGTMKRVCSLIALAIGLGGGGGLSAGEGPEAGDVHLIRSANSAFDRYTQGTAWQEWIRNRFHRMLVYSPYFDSRLSWYPDGIVYFDLYAIYVSSTIAAQHGDWVLKDRGGNRLYIPWGCSRGSCPQYAADPSNPDFRKWWINQAQDLLSRGYRGLFVDDVNMEFRVGNGDGAFVNPVDSNTGKEMAWEDWRRYVAEFTEQIRTAFPNTEIVHNSIWFAGPSGVRDNDPYIQRQLAAADLQCVEFGVSDSGLTGGNGSFSHNALLGYIDRLHNNGRGVIIGGVNTDPIGREYSLANYFLVSNGNDYLASNQLTADNWWDGFRVTLGMPAGPRTTWNGLLRRDFSGGIVLVNPPQGSVTTVPLPKSFRTIDGNFSVTSVTLGPRQGAILLLDTLGTGGH